MKDLQDQRGLEMKDLQDQRGLEMKDLRVLERDRNEGSTGPERARNEGSTGPARRPRRRRWARSKVTLALYMRAREASLASKHPRAGGLDPRGSYFWIPPEAGPPELLFEIKLCEPRQTRPNRLS